MENTTTDYEQLVKNYRSSSWNKHPYNVTVHYKNKDRFISSLLFYTDGDLEREGKIPTTEEFFEKATPEFQRSNDKWNKDMKIKFIQNLLKGCPTVIKLFNVGKDTNDAQLIDGLQRTTTMIEFMDGKFPIEGNVYCKDLGDTLKQFRTSIELEIYTFDNWEEVGRYYIDMNENISHSKEDIEKCKKWFKEVKGIIL